MYGMLDIRQIPILCGNRITAFNSGCHSAIPGAIRQITGDGHWIATQAATLPFTFPEAHLIPG